MQTSTNTRARAVRRAHEKGQWLTDQDFTMAEGVEALTALGVKGAGQFNKSMMVCRLIHFPKAKVLALLNLH